MLCIVQLGRSINIQRLAFTTISNLINGGSSIQLRVDELVSSLRLDAALHTLDIVVRA